MPSRRAKLRKSDVVIRGHDRVIQQWDLLRAFAAQCSQDGRMDDLPYFLEKPGLFPQTPHLFLFTKREVLPLGGIREDELAPQHLIAAVLLWEYRVAGLHTRAFTIADRTGGALLAPPELRLRIAARIRDKLMADGASVALISTDATDTPGGEADLLRTAQTPPGYTWGWRHRPLPVHLELQSTMDATLAKMGQKTRQNLRYYRRRAERELGCHFIPNAHMTPHEAIQLNNISTHSVSADTVRWRLRAHKLLQDPFLMGIKDDAGRWLSIVGGRRYNGTTEILWQMNRNDLPLSSLSTVLRSYYMEHEIQRGMKYLTVEGGTPHTMTNSFVKRDVYDVVLLRKPLLSPLRAVMAHRVSKDNLLLEMLQAPDVVWR
ncbi:MAG: hypothetical protein V4734_04760 [Terriglobus sp.]